MTPEELLRVAAQEGIRVRAHQGRLQIQDPRKRLTAEFHQGLLENQVGLIQLLQERLAETSMLDSRLSRARWCAIRSRLLGGETFLLVIADEHLDAAKQAHPDKVVYLLDEILPVIDAGISDDGLRLVHSLKKRFGGSAEVLRGETDLESDLLGT